jgi:uncharacterized membrane protein YcaP (DUF421 family)
MIGLSYWLKAVIFYAVALFLLRLAGKRAISQKAPIEVVVMIALGTLLAHPLKSHNVVISLYGGMLLVVGLILLSLLEIYFPLIEGWLTGEPILLIEDGNLLKNNMKKARITVDALNMRLRVNKINNISKVKRATLEVSGDLGIELFPEQSMPTMKDIDEIKNGLNVIANHLGVQLNIVSHHSNSDQNIFSIIKDKRPS